VLLPGRMRLRKFAKLFWIFEACEATTVSIMHGSRLTRARTLAYVCAYTCTFRVAHWKIGNSTRCGGASIGRINNAMKLDARVAMLTQTARVGRNIVRKILPLDVTARFASPYSATSDFRHFPFAPPCTRNSRESASGEHGRTRNCSFTVRDR